MAEARRCDRCNEFYSIDDENEKRGEYHPVSISYKKSVGSMTLYDNNVNRIKHLDLCPACSRSLIVWLNDCGQYDVAAEDTEKENDITVKLPESEYGECPYYKSESSGLMCKRSATCDEPCNTVELYKMQEVNVTDKIDHVNCPYRKDVVCAPNKDTNCVMCDVYKQIFGEEDKGCSKEEEPEVKEIDVKDNNICKICKFHSIAIYERPCSVCINYDMYIAQVAKEKAEEVLNKVEVKMREQCKHKDVLAECNPCRSCGSFNNFEPKEDSE